MDCTRLSKLKKQLKAKYKKLDELRKQVQEAGRERYELEKAVHKENLKLNIGKQVKRACRSSDNPELNDAVGILTAVRRTRCSIDFGEFGKWGLAIEDVITADCKQGYVLDYLMAGGTL